MSESDEIPITDLTPAEQAALTSETIIHAKAKHDAAVLKGRIDADEA